VRELNPTSAMAAAVVAARTDRTMTNPLWIRSPLALSCRRYAWWKSHREGQTDDGTIG
jgi:hypothetical protein